MGSNKSSEEDDENQAAGSGMYVCHCCQAARPTCFETYKLTEFSMYTIAFSDTVLQIDNRSGADMNNTDTHKSIVASGPTGELVFTPSHENFAITILGKVG